MVLLANMETHDVALCFSSIYWLSGLGTLLFATLLGCTRLITTNPFSPELFLRMIEKYKVNFVLTPPSHLALTMKHENIKKTDMSSLRNYMCGGSIVAEDLCKQLRSYLPHGDIYVGYGLSEIAGIATVNYPPKPGAVGLLTGGMQVKIIDDDGKQCGVNESGEICLKVPFMFIGYHGNE